MPEPPRVAVLVPNLFLRVPVDSAVRGAGAEPVALGSAETAPGGCRVVIVDLDALGQDPATAIRAWVRSGVAVLGFGPHVDAKRLAAARQAGAVVLPRSAFLGRLPELVVTALASAGVATPPHRGGGSHGDETAE